MTAKQGQGGCGSALLFLAMCILVLLAFVLLDISPALSAASQQITVPVQGIGMFVKLLFGG